MRKLTQNKKLGLFGLACFIVPLSIYIAKNSGEADSFELAPSVINFSLIPEYAKTSAIMVSEHLFGNETGGAALTSALVETGIDVFILKDPSQVEAEANSKELMLDDLGLSHLSDLQKANIQFIPAAHESFWLRDFGPHSLKMSYSSGEQEIALVNFIYRSETSLEDTIPHQIALQTQKSLVHIPTVLDGGNLLTNGQDCLLAHDPELMDSDSSIKATEAKLTRLFKNRLGCQKVILIQDAPHEHIDMWAKFVNSNTLLINEISMTQIDALDEESSHLKAFSIVVKNSLDRIAADLAKNYNIIRIPMLLPSPEFFPTYTNSILINQSVFVPHYRKAKQYGASNQNAVDLIEKEVAGIYEKFGFKVQFIHSDYLIENGGSLHCVTMPLYNHHSNPTISDTHKSNTTTL